MTCQWHANDSIPEKSLRGLDLDLLLVNCGTTLSWDAGGTAPTQPGAHEGKRLTLSWCCAAELGCLTGEVHAFQFTMCVLARNPALSPGVSV